MFFTRSESNDLTESYSVSPWIVLLLIVALFVRLGKQADQFKTDITTDSKKTAESEADGYPGKGGNLNDLELEVIILDIDIPHKKTLKSTITDAITD